ncbi:ATPase P [Longimonas halophila]|uniref:P-type Zn(2+) transporter n=1 Tax=Longimonas halophila TaxID=1469170 RepID=A0A2H3NJ31_9BACT|nr:cation-translocating P-type ATPase [Longimonas halophila]PEN05567.1 ATPase P [Longimonas halophila]
MERRELAVDGMDCAGCARSVKGAIEQVQGVQEADVRLMAGKVVVTANANAQPWPAVSDAIERAGYTVADSASEPKESAATQTHTRRSMGVLAAVAAAVLAMAVLGHGLGVFAWIERVVPWPLGVAATFGLGYPVFKKVAVATLNRRIIAHTLMAVGVAAALATGEWVTALIIVIFMRLGDYVESFTTERARDALRTLVHQTPQQARIERESGTEQVSIGEVVPGDVVQVRPGEKIPVDGTVLEGHATIDQSAITGESMPVEAMPGDSVFAATVAHGGRLRIRAEEIGEDTTFGRVVQMVEEAEAHRGRMQQWADQFSGYYLPFVAAAAGATYLIGGSIMATVAVLVVACSCAFALATPVAMLAAIGTSARQGVLIKGGKYIEALAQADTLLIDKTGTLTLGEPRITDVISINGITEAELLRLAAATEQHSEHPLGAAVRRAATARELDLPPPHDFEAVPGRGVRATVDGTTVAVGNASFVGNAPGISTNRPGQTPLYVSVDDELAGVLWAADAERAGVQSALDALRNHFDTLEILTGDAEQTAEVVAERFGLAYRAELLPDDKIAAVRAHQDAGRTVVMVGDGVNDAPALAQADVGIAMGAGGTDVAIDAAHIVLMRDDWALVPAVVQTATRALGVVKSNLVLTAVYNMLALGAASVGYLPPVLAAALHSIPDLGILANSSRLLRRSSVTAD